MSFFNNILWRPALALPTLASAAFGIAAFFGLDKASTSEKLGWTLAVIFLIWAIYLVKVAREVYGRHAPVSVRYMQKCIEGFNSGKLLIVLDKASWLSVGQLLVLVSTNNQDTQSPLFLIYVETVTESKGYPQCVALNLMSGIADQYVADPAKWKSLVAHPKIQKQYLEPIDA